MFKKIWNLIGIKNDSDLLIYLMTIIIGYQIAHHITCL